VPDTQIAPRIHAAPLTGRGWLNTAGEPLSLEGLRGRFVLLDFWTFCCINCLHVLDELRELERHFADVLVIVGVHSPKFAHEADPDALAAAVERYGVHHPVLDDPDLATWQAYTARAWPTLVLIDPEGYVVAQLSGEGHAHGLEVLLTDLVAEHERRGTLRRGDGPYVPPPAPASALRFPGKVVALPSGAFLVSDTGHHQLVELDPDLVTERRRIGSGERGFDDGSPDVASFCEPQGLLVLPDAVAAEVGYDLLVADTVNHALRGVRLAGGAVRTVAGTGRQLRERGGSGVALEQPLSSPWDLAWFDDAVVVAMAGTHQLWRFDPVGRTVEVLAGTSAEGLRDGGAVQAWFAQPSGLATAADGSRVWIADAETSALRHLTRGGDDRLAVRSDVGVGLFDFGHVDGPASGALMQHPLGVTELPDASVAVCDTYNGAVRRFDPVSGEVSTLATGLAEPSDAVVEHGDGGPVLVVVESAAHRLTRVRIPLAAQQVRGEVRQVSRPPTALRSGAVSLRIGFVPPAGQKLDDRYGDPTRLEVSASPESLLESGSGAAPGLSRALRFAEGATGGVLHISVQAAACDGDPVTGKVPEFAACHLYQQDWGIPVTIGPSGAGELALPLRAT
jgi:thiol-disulfide isomerase/thioredoxin